MSQVDQYRENAAECQHEAKKSIAAHDKQQWLKIAEHWLKLADAVEQSGTDD
jgi:hypothetical protein